MKANKKLYVNIGNISIPYTLTESKQARCIRLTIDLNGFRVVKPHSARINDVERALEAKRSWIYKHYLELQSRKAGGYKREWESGEKVLYKGKEYEIRIFKHEDKRTAIKFNGTRFEIFTNKEIEVDERKFLVENVLKRWYKKAVRVFIEDRLDYFCKITGLTYNIMRIKEQKTRWGSCSKKGNLNFNWKLIMSPEWVIDYIVVHEVCHLRYLNHSREFWNMVALYMPGYKKARKWLKENGPGLKL
ncbi:MAG: hypothetical protein XD78_1473 [Desulfotomaculum sp. 46_296]|nr:MAG: hypothetical protein XD78_1473 [Desulfotomaculum sp. 46_296]HAU32647.1 hypothetical protein [Desulfotomaculum sp.]